jgi:23S rRNA pseudouridine1911/1915/1917 synthase
MTKSTRLNVHIPEEYAGMRLDQALSELFPQYSRSRLQQWIKDGNVQVDNRRWRPKDKVLGGEGVELEAVVESDDRWEAQAIPLDVLYEDDDIIVVNKPAGLVVHPAAGNPDGTLLNALLHHAPQVAGLPRAGIVHRLDKDTSGILVAAKTLEARTGLVEQLQAREFTREYDAVVEGTMTGGGKVDAPIGRHPVDRKRMAVTAGGKPAVTHYRLAERFAAHTWLKVRLETGRTHQIRVHMAYIRHPLVGDPVYRGRLRMPAGAGEALRQALHAFRRQALHASRLGLTHPRTGEWMEWEVPMADDLAMLIETLRNDGKESS